MSDTLKQALELLESARFSLVPLRDHWAASLILINACHHLEHGNRYYNTSMVAEYFNQQEYFAWCDTVITADGRTRADLLANDHVSVNDLGGFVPSEVAA